MILHANYLNIACESFEHSIEQPIPKGVGFMQKSSISKLTLVQLNKSI